MAMTPEIDGIDDLRYTHVPWLYPIFLVCYLVDGMILKPFFLLNLLQPWRQYRWQIGDDQQGEIGRYGAAFVR